MTDKLQHPHHDTPPQGGALLPDIHYEVKQGGEWLPALCVTASDNNNGVFLFVDTSNDTLHTISSPRGDDEGCFRAV